MNYPELPVDVLELFVEAGRAASLRRLDFATMIWGEAYRSGRTSFPQGKTVLGKAPILLCCARCRFEFSLVSEVLLKSHVPHCARMLRARNGGGPEGKRS